MAEKGAICSSDDLKAVKKKGGAYDYLFSADSMTSAKLDERSVLQNCLTQGEASGLNCVGQT